MHIYKVPEREATHFLQNPANRESTYFRYERERERPYQTF